MAGAAGRAPRRVSRIGRAWPGRPGDDSQPSVSAAREHRRGGQSPRHDAPSASGGRSWTLCIRRALRRGPRGEISTVVSNQTACRSQARRFGCTSNFNQPIPHWPGALGTEAWQLSTSFSGPNPDGWSFEVNLERARRYRDIHTVIDFLAISYPEDSSRPRCQPPPPHWARHAPCLPPTTKRSWSYTVATRRARIF